MKNIFLLIMVFSLCAACKNENKPKEELSVPEKIAQANGLEQFKEVKQLKYTFNVKLKDSLVTSRSWKWKPQQHQVTYSSDSVQVNYNHETEAEAHPDIDPKFINDQYWLLFPLHLAWDEMDFELKDPENAPISGKKMKKVIISYPDDAGYTPGDVYEIYFDNNFLIREWIYRSGGSSKNALIATWEDYKEFKGLKIATQHRSKQGDFQLFFSNVEVEY